LPINADELKKKIKALELLATQQKITQIFIETPYRNNPMFQHIVQNCLPTTKLCIAKNITSNKEWIVTKTIQQWKTQTPELHKEPVIFLIGS
jgi:16S rRNA (cytidine1402-2'-O)-methyltransferase